MRIAVIKNGSSPAVQYYRSLGVFPHLSRETGGQVQFSYFDIKALHWSDIYMHDVIYVDHPMTPAGTKVIEDATRQGKQVWIDLDDYLFEITPGNRALAYYSNPHNMEAVRKVLGMASLITVTTDPLKKAYSEFNGNVHIVPNAWNHYQWPLQPITPAQPVARITWRGSDTHGVDLHGIRGVLNEIQKDPAFAMLFFGWHEAWGVWLDIDRQRQVVPEMEMFQFFHTYFSCGADYLLYPLIDHPFNRAKSNIAWIEACIAGMATIAPACMPEFNQPGVIRYKDARHLRDILSNIKRGRIDKAEQVELSRDALQETRLSETNRLRLEALAGLVGARVVKEPVQAPALKAVK